MQAFKPHVDNLDGALTSISQTLFSFLLLVTDMKRIVLSLASIALLSAVVAPMAQAAPAPGNHLNPYHAGIFPRILTPAQTASPDVEPSAQPTVPALEQARMNRLDRAGNTNGSLNAYQQRPASDLDPHNLASVSPLQQMRLDRLNNSN